MNIGDRVQVRLDQDTYVFGMVREFVLRYADRRTLLKVDGEDRHTYAVDAEDAVPAHLVETPAPRDLLAEERAALDVQNVHRHDILRHVFDVPRPLDVQISEQDVSFDVRAPLTYAQARCLDRVYAADGNDWTVAAEDVVTRTMTLAHGRMTQRVYGWQIDEQEYALYAEPLVRGRVDEAGAHVHGTGESTAPRDEDGPPRPSNVTVADLRDGLYVQYRGQTYWATYDAIGHTASLCANGKLVCVLTRGQVENGALEFVF